MKPLKTGRPKNKPELKQLTSEWIRALQTAQKTTPQKKKRKKEKKKELGGRWLRKTA